MCELFNCQNALLNILVIASTILIQRVISYDPHCPTQCNCVPNRMSCEVPGLRRLPNPYTMELEFLHVTNQTFDSTHLGSAELQIYRAPEFGGKIRLKSLLIRSCNIQTIGSYAFQQLGSKLEQLDLTGNPLVRIENYAFAGLSYLTLVLDKIGQPIFEPKAFSNLAGVKSLFMQHSRLTRLPYEPLLRLTTEGKLGNLLLKGNHFTVLQQEYDNIFSKVQNFNIEENPWNCGCEINWLIRRYQVMLRQKLDAFAARSQNPGSEHLEAIWGLVDSQPKCATPAFLAGRNFSDLITNVDDIFPSTRPSTLYSPPNVLHCSPPKLQSIEVDLNKFNFPGNAKYSESAKNKVTLKCLMQGSSRLNVTWVQQSSALRGSPIAGGIPINTRVNPVNNPASWSKRSAETIALESTVEVLPENSLNTYVCLGQDVIGNVSTLVRIQLPDEISNPSKIQVPASTTTSLIQGQQEHMLPSSEWATEILGSSYSALHSPQYSLSQLLGAIIGTFLSTVLLFFVIHRALHFHWNSCSTSSRQVTMKTGTKVPRSSPGGRSSSNDSSNMKLLSANSSGEGYPNPLPNPLSNDSTATNFLNARAYHQLMNEAAGLGFTTLPIDFGGRPSIAPPLDHTGKLPIFAPDSCRNSISASYEPVSYTDPNNMTYDVPWNANQPNASNGCSFPVHNGQLFLSERNSIYDGKLPGTGAMLQPPLMIPPPPSMPQPPTPQSTIMNGTLGSSTVPTTNLLVLQAAYPPPSLANAPRMNTGLTPSESASLVSNINQLNKS